MNEVDVGYHMIISLVSMLVVCIHVCLYVWYISKKVRKKKTFEAEFSSMVGNGYIRVYFSLETELESCMEKGELVIYSTRAYFLR